MSNRLEDQKLVELFDQYNQKAKHYENVDLLIKEFLYKAYRAGFAHGQASSSKLESKPQEMK